MCIVKYNILILLVSLAILVHLFRFIMSQDCYVGCAGTDQPVADIGLKNSEGENPSPFHKRKYNSSDHRGVSTQRRNSSFYDIKGDYGEKGS